MQPGSAYASEIGPDHFGMLDLARIPRPPLEDLLAASSMGEAASATDHFLVLFALRCDIEPRPLIPQLIEHPCRMPFES